MSENKRLKQKRRDDGGGNKMKNQWQKPVLDAVFFVLAEYCNTF